MGFVHVEFACQVTEAQRIEIELDGVYHDVESWRRYTLAVGFVELTHYYRPDGVPREQQPWLASVWRKSAP